MIIGGTALRLSHPTSFVLQATSKAHGLPPVGLELNYAFSATAHYFDCVYQVWSCFLNGGKRLRFFQ